MKKKQTTINKMISKIYGTQMPSVGIGNTLITQKIIGEDFTQIDIDDELLKKINKKKIKKEEK